MNIAKILRDCPKGTKLYSPLFGECKLINIDYTYNRIYPIKIEVGDETYDFTENGLFYKKHINGECMLFPSKDNRDWSTFKAPKQKCNFKPFDKVLVRNYSSDVWQISFFAYFVTVSQYNYQTIGGGWKQCIPYEGNEHLLGTSNNSN